MVWSRCILNVCLQSQGYCHTVSWWLVLMIGIIWQWSPNWWIPMVVMVLKAAATPHKVCIVRFWPSCRSYNPWSLPSLFWEIRSLYTPIVLVPGFWWYRGVFQVMICIFVWWLSSWTLGIDNNFLVLDISFLILPVSLLFFDLNQDRHSFSYRALSGRTCFPFSITGSQVCCNFLYPSLVFCSRYQPCRWMSLSSIGWRSRIPIMSSSILYIFHWDSLFV